MEVRLQDLEGPTLCMMILGEFRIENGTSNGSGNGNGFKWMHSYGFSQSLSRSLPQSRSALVLAAWSLVIA